MTEEIDMKTGEITGDGQSPLLLEIQWKSATFPKSRAGVAVIKVETTQEINNKEERDVLRHLCDDDSVGWMAYVNNAEEARQLEIPKAPARRHGAKSQAERIRNTIAVIYRDAGEPYGSTPMAYERYYEERTEEILFGLKSELPRRNSSEQR